MDVAAYRLYYGLRKNHFLNKKIILIKAKAIKAAKVLVVMWTKFIALPSHTLVSNLIYMVLFLKKGMSVER